MDYIISLRLHHVRERAIKDVMITLLEAIGLVILVVLSSCKAGVHDDSAAHGSGAWWHLGLFPLLGFRSISPWLAWSSIGIVVDDAIVVVEAVQRHIDEGMAPRDATSGDEGSAGAGDGHRLHLAAYSSRWAFWRHQRECVEARAARSRD